EIQPWEFRVALFQFRDDAQRLLVVVEAAMIFHQAGEDDFAGMSKGGMTQIMCETNAFDQVFVAAKSAGKRPPDLGNFQCVGEAESCGRQDSVTVTLEGCAIFRRSVDIGTPFGMLAARAIRR